MKTGRLVVAVAALLLTAAGRAVGATTPEIVPATAAPGTTVTFLNGCLGVVEEPPAEVTVAFVEGDEVPENPATWKAAGRLIGPFTYSFEVPALAAGEYRVYLECAPNDWRTNLVEGASGLVSLTVQGMPGTDVAGDPPGVSHRDETGPWPVVLVAAALASLVAVRRLRRVRPL